MPALEEPAPHADAGLITRQRVGLWLGPLLGLALLLAPLDVQPPAHAMAAVGSLVVVLWISEALPLAATALLGPALAALLGVAKAREVFAPFADPVILLFLGSFLMAEALRVHGLDRRLALRVLALPGATRSPRRVQWTVGLVTALVSMWISNTATTAMMLPIGLGLVRALMPAGGPAEQRRTSALLLMIGLSASIGGVATPVGTPPNLIGLGLLRQLGGITLSFPAFMLLGLPLSLGLLGLAAFVLGRALPDPEAHQPLVTDLLAEHRALPPWGAGQWACAAAFGFAVTFWVLPSVAALALPAGHAWVGWLARCEESVVALLAASLLFAWPVGGGQRALTWAHAQRIDWGTLLLFGGGLSMGKLFFDTGLAGVLGRAAVSATGVQSLWGLTALALAAAILLTEVTSNTAAVNMLVPLVAAIAKELGVPLAPPVLAVTLGASMAFMLPISTPPNAIVYGTGRVPLADMVRVGVLLDVLSFFLILGTLRLLCPLLGLA